jgi:hypothetical protein
MTMATTKLTNVLAAIDTWHVAPADQGQIMEVAYGCDWESEIAVRRTTDRSDGTVTYATAAAPAAWEPWNRAPVARWAEAR